jgi:methyl-accepting chemotaxis protein
LINFFLSIVFKRRYILQYANSSTTITALLASGGMQVQWFQSFRTKLFTLLALAIAGMVIIWTFFQTGAASLQNQVQSQTQVMTELKSKSAEVFSASSTVKDAFATNEQVVAVKLEFTDVAYRAIVNSYELDVETHEETLSTYEAIVPRILEIGSVLSADDQKKLEDELGTFKLTMGRSWFFLGKGQFDMAASMYTVGFESFTSVMSLLGQIEASTKSEVEAANSILKDAATTAASSADQGLVSSQNISSSLDTTGRSVMFSVVIAGILMVLFSLFIIRSIIEQVKYITNRIVKIESANDLSHELGYAKQDELRPLAEAFDRLISSFRTILTSAQSITEDTGENAQANAELVTTIDEKVYEQHLQLDSAAVALHEMSATARSVAELTTNVEVQTSEATDQAKHSLTLLAKSQDALTSLESEVGGTAQTISELNQATDQIQQVMDIIKAISEQTNLLALNAAIEAARAGENGRGFAVVADEVRTLASKTAASTTDVEEAITSLLEGSGRSVNAMNQIVTQTKATNESLSEAQGEVQAVVDAMTSIDAATSQISEAVTEQSTTTESIDANVENVRATSEITKEALTQLQERAQNNVEVAEQLQGEIRKFIV